MVLVGERPDLNIRVWGGWLKVRPSPVTHCAECWVGRRTDLNGCVEEAISYPEPAFEGGKWGDRPRPRASGLRSSL